MIALVFYLYRDSYMWLWRQDNAPIHKARATAAWFEVQRINVLEWPAKSPNLNPIENLWGIMTRRVYAGNKQYSTKDELRRAILREWDAASNELLIKLTESMSKRVIEVIGVEGNSIKYWALKICCQRTNFERSDTE